MAKACSFFGITRSGYYKAEKEGVKEEMKEDMVIELVQEARREMPRIGVRKLYYMLRPQLVLLGGIGRDRLFDILRRHGLLVEVRRRFAHTTDSHHHFHVYRNLKRDMELTGANQCVVADITYLRVDDAFVYLALLTDAFSRKIVGWDLSASLSVEGAYRAAQMMLRQLPKGTAVVHHSDRGVQYCCHAYTRLLAREGARISMTEENHCYENGLAERVNGILKQEFMLDGTFRDMDSCRKAVAQAIDTYNNKRPHSALDYRTPAEVHSAAA